jgi:multiple sugar transport system substrate-binding protein
MSKRKLQVIVLLALLTAVLGAARVFAQDTFFGKTADDLFPDSPTQSEKDLAFKALLAANIPDGHALGEGKTITIATLGQGARGGISGTVYFWRPAFEAATGAKLEIVEVPYNQLGTTIPADFLTGQHTYDAFVAAAWQYGDWVSNEWIQPIDQYIGDARFPAWSPDDTAPAFRALLQWQGKTYGTQMDGDAQLLYYRNDILTDPKWQEQFKTETGKDMVVPPQTWQQLYDITNFFNGKDWNGDGDPDDGITLHLQAGGQGHFHFSTLAASFAVTPSAGDDPRKVSKYHNVYWFDPDDMTPLINDPGHVMALEFLQKLAKTGPDDQYGWALRAAWDDFLLGNAVATFSWGDVGSLSQHEDSSKIIGKLGAAAIPCSDTWYDRETQKTVTDADHPNCVGNTTGGTWHPVLSAFSDDPELTYYFMAMIADKSINFYDETTGWQGLDPCCNYSLFPPKGNAKIEDYTSVGFNADDMQRYITAYGANVFDKPIYETYLRIPGTLEYIQNSLDVHLSEAMTGQKSAQEALDATADDWNKTTDGLGRDSQLKIYDDSIGYTPGS